MKQNSVDKIIEALKKNFQLNVNKIALNKTKTEVILFKNKKKTNLSKNTDFDLKSKLEGKGLYPTKSIKYLCIKIDDNLNPE